MGDAKYAIAEYLDVEIDSLTVRNINQNHKSIPNEVYAKYLSKPEHIAIQGMSIMRNNSGRYRARLFRHHGEPDVLVAKNLRDIVKSIAFRHNFKLVGAGGKTFVSYMTKDDNAYTMFRRSLSFNVHVQVPDTRISLSNRVLCVKNKLGRWAYISVINKMYNIADYDAHILADGNSLGMSLERLVLELRDRHTYGDKAQKKRIEKECAILEGFNITRSNYTKKGGSLIWSFIEP
jgi:hypothetical protein